MDEHVILILVSSLVIFAVLIYNPSKTYGVPAALIFIVLGFFVGNGKILPAYDYPETTEFVSQFAISIIIFSGGFNTPVSHIKPVLTEGLLLANIGVLATTVLLGFFVSFFTPLSLMEGMLLGAVVSSTDAAATFSILESKKLKLKYKTDKALEFESAINDPMALILTLLFSHILLSGEPFNLSVNLVFFVKQVGIGAAVALGIGYLIKLFFRYYSFHEEALKPIFLLALLLGSTLAAQKIGGNLLVASYILGIMLGNVELQHKKTSRKVFDSFTWLAQAVMFVLLGLQIFPDQVLEVFKFAWLPALFLFIIARPITVFSCYLPLKQPWNKKMFISWIGIKGATPIVFALLPLTMDVPNGDIIFNIVIIIVLASMVLHGFTLGPAARIFKLIDK